MFTDSSSLRPWIDEVPDREQPVQAVDSPGTAYPSHSVLVTILSRTRITCETMSGFGLTFLLTSDSTL